MNQSNRASVERLVEQQRSGFALEQPFYTDDEVFKRDLERIVARQWLFVDHESRIPSPGDYFLYEIAGESIIVVRGEDREVHAHFNVCRHRGSRVCIAAQGNARRLVCPYHAWAYALDGRLLNGQMPEGFDPAEFGLHPCRARVFEGLIYVNLAPDDLQPNFDVIAGNLRPLVGPHGLPGAKIAHREVYPTHANWKLVVENFRECYHCLPAHPEYTEVNAYVRVNEKNVGAFSETARAWAAKVAEMGHAHEGVDSTDFPVQPHGGQRSPIREGFVSLTADGTPAGPLMGDFERYDGGETFVYVGPLHYMSLANDHATVFRFTPIHATLTEVVVTWLVDAQASPAEDYDVDHLKWMWDVTTVEDTRIINDNQKGVNSRRYTPGPYSMREGWTQKFIDWYLERVR